jgi:hypothetical protein
MTLEHFDTLFAFVVILAGVSLLVTVLVQMASALFGLRGSNLRWGLKTLLANADPQLATHAEMIAQKVLHHPLISDSTFSEVLPRLLSRWRLASAIRKDELVEILRSFAQQSPTVQPAGAAETWDTALRRAFDKLAPERAAKLVLAVPKVKEMFADDPSLAALALAPVVASAEELPAQIDRWFDSVMDRVSQRFALHTRLWTVFFSVLLAFALHLDAFRLLTQLSTDAELRARLVASADALVHKADETLAPPGAADLYVQTMKELIRANPKDLGKLPEPTGFTDLAGAKAWLAAQLQAAAIPNTELWLKQYESTVSQASLRASAADLRDILDNKLKFQLIPDPYPQPFYNYWTPSWLHLWGVIASAALLSLGAPFWFNMLKSMSNLRPVLANKQAQEAAQTTDR